MKWIHWQLGFSKEGLQMRAKISRNKNIILTLQSFHFFIMKGDMSNEYFCKKEKEYISVCCMSRQAVSKTFIVLLFQIIHNYGHQGSGVTLHWGCALHATQLLQDALKKQTAAKL